MEIQQVKNTSFLNSTAECVYTVFTVRVYTVNSMWQEGRGVNEEVEFHLLTLISGNHLEEGLSWTGSKKQEQEGKVWLLVNLILKRT